MLTVCVSVYFVGNQATVRICALCMRTMPPVAMGGRPLVACQHAGRWYNGGYGPSVWGREAQEVEEEEEARPGGW